MPHASSHGSGLPEQKPGAAADKVDNHSADCKERGVSAPHASGDYPDEKERTPGDYHTQGDFSGQGAGNDRILFISAAFVGAVYLFHFVPVRGLEET